MERNYIQIVPQGKKWAVRARRKWLSNLLAPSLSTLADAQQYARSFAYKEHMRTGRPFGITWVDAMGRRQYERGFG